MKQFISILAITLLASSAHAAGFKAQTHFSAKLKNNPGVLRVNMDQQTVSLTSQAPALAIDLPIQDINTDTCGIVHITAGNGEQSMVIIDRAGSHCAPDASEAPTAIELTDGSGSAQLEAKLLVPNLQ